MSTRESDGRGLLRFTGCRPVNGSTRPQSRRESSLQDHSPTAEWGPGGLSAFRRET